MDEALKNDVEGLRRLAPTLTPADAGRLRRVCDVVEVDHFAAIRRLPSPRLVVNPAEERLAVQSDEIRKLRGELSVQGETIENLVEIVRGLNESDRKMLETLEKIVAG